MRSDELSLTRAAATVFVVIWLAVQITVPAVALFTDRPERFSWQMFSALSRSPHYVLVQTDGSEEQVRNSDLLEWVRADLDYAAHLPDHLCETRDDLAEVRIVPRGEDEAERVVRCPGREAAG